MCVTCMLYVLVIFAVVCSTIIHVLKSFRREERNNDKRVIIANWILFAPIKQAMATSRSIMLRLSNPQKSSISKY